MKRVDLVRHIERHRCELLREGGSHSVYPLWRVLGDRPASRRRHVSSSTLPNDAPKRLLGIALATGVLLPALVAAAEAGLTHRVTATTDYDAMALAAFSNASYGEVLKANWRYDSPG